MSLSNPSKETVFQAASWQSFGAKGSKSPLSSTPAGQGGRRGGFEAILAPKKEATVSPEFVSPYVSQEKLRQLNAASRKTAGGH